MLMLTPKKQPKEKQTENPTKTRTLNEMKTEYWCIETKNMKEWTETNRKMKKITDRSKNWK